MTEFSFSDKDLQHAAFKVRTALLESLPAPSDCTHEFSDCFLDKMEVVVQQNRRHQTRKTFLLRIAAVFLALLIGAGALFAFSPEVRAAVTQWVREVYENSIVYRFFENDISTSECVPLYSPDWLPDGYFIADDYLDENMRSIMYQNDSGTIIVVFEYYIANENTLVELLTNKDTQEKQTLRIQGWTADLYFAAEQSDTTNLIWVDDSKNLVFGVHGNAAPDVLIQIAESISAEK